MHSKQLLGTTEEIEMALAFVTVLIGGLLSTGLGGLVLIVGWTRGKPASSFPELLEGLLLPALSKLAKIGGIGFRMPLSSTSANEGLPLAEGFPADRNGL